MANQKMTDKTSVRISKKNRDRLYAIGVKGESFDDVLSRMFSVINNLEASLESASQKIQHGRETGLISVMQEGASELEGALENFVKSVEGKGV